MKQLIKIFIGLYLILMVLACQKLFDHDISEDTVFLNSPIDGMQTDNYLQTFWWNDIYGATGIIYK